jgi:protein-tyrosine-phosphatase
MTLRVQEPPAPAVLYGVNGMACSSAGQRTPGRLASGRQRLSDAAVRFVERWRMDRIRRDPRVLVTTLGSAKSMLIVCHGNIIRSPFTQRLIARELGDDGGVSISSAGLMATPGTPPPPMALLAAARLQVDLGNHAASLLTSEAVATSDVVFVMDAAQLGVMRRRFPEARSKVFLLTCLAPQSPLEVRDPVDGDESMFQACYGHISESVRPIVRLLAARAGLR